MSLFDMRTVVFSYIISNAICAIVMTFLWIQNRRRFAGLDFWLANYVMQFAAMVLFILRGPVPELVSAVAGNALLVGGTVLLYMGLERFAGKRGPQIQNVLLLAFFILVHTSLFNPHILEPLGLAQFSLAAREVNISLGLLVICFQCAWLLLYRVDVDMRPIARGVGIISAAFCLVSVVRIIVDVAMPPENDFFRGDTYDTLLILTYQMLFITLTFGLSLMVSRRLLVDLERDIAVRQQAEDALESLSKFPAENPNC